MRNDEAAIIARSRSQNLSGIPFEREIGVVVYDERTEL